MVPPQTQKTFRPRATKSAVCKREIAMWSFEAFDLNPLTCNYDLWVGTGTLAAILAGGFRPDLSYPMWRNEGDAINGWICKARRENSRGLPQLVSWSKL